MQVHQQPLSQRQQQQQRRPVRRRRSPHANRSSQNAPSSAGSLMRKSVTNASAISGRTGGGQPVKLISSLIIIPVFTTLRTLERVKDDQGKVRRLPTTTSRGSSRPPPTSSQFGSLRLRDGGELIAAVTCLEHLFVVQPC